MEEEQSALKKLKTINGKNLFKKVSNKVAGLCKNLVMTNETSFAVAA